MIYRNDRKNSWFYLWRIVNITVQLSWNYDKWGTFLLRRENILLCTIEEMVADFFLGSRHLDKKLLIFMAIFYYRLSFSIVCYLFSLSLYFLLLIFFFVLCLNKLISCSIFISILCITYKLLNLIWFFCRFVCDIWIFGDERNFYINGISNNMNSL